MSQEHFFTGKRVTTSAPLSVFLAAAMFLWEHVYAEGNMSPVGPSIEETNKILENGNAYRTLITSTLRWKAPPTPECVNSRIQIEQVSIPRGLIDPTKFNGAEVKWIDVQQQAEEGDLAALSLFSRLIYDTIRSGCLELSQLPR